ncbi:hypothetical protein TWF718_004884 [Orbilia javanica]|uniref:Uncharacterized protein n=1 Tax=Orbilia javanica TaxID=47235 RepID=A0AAN8MY75_9PEZI
MLLRFEVGPSKKLGVEHSNQAASSENVLSRASVRQLALDFLRPSALGGATGHWKLVPHRSGAAFSAVRYCSMYI